MFFRPPHPQLIQISHVQQQRAGECLVACVQMVCRYLDVRIEYQRLVKLLEVQQEIGVSFSKIYNLERLRLKVIYEKGGTLPLLYDLIAAGWPVIASVQTKELPHWQGIASFHAVLVVGMDEQSVYINDPEWPNAPILVPTGDFDLAWLDRGERYAVLWK